MSNLAKLLRDTAEAIRPHIEQTLDLREIFADYRKAVTDAGGDWMALKNLVKARIEDERDDSGNGDRVARIVERADLASAYADMLGLNANLNENNSFEIEYREESRERQMSQGPAAIAGTGDRKPEASLQDRIADAPEFASVPAGTAAHHDFDRPPPIPDFLRRDA